MEDLGFINATNIEFGLFDQPEALLLRYTDEQKHITVALASLSAAEFSASLLYFASQQIARMSEEDRKASLERYKVHPRLYPIVVGGMDYDAQNDELVVGLDASVLRFKLTDEAKAQFKELAKRL